MIPNEIQIHLFLNNKGIMSSIPQSVLSYLHSITLHTNYPKRLLTLNPQHYSLFTNPYSLNPKFPYPISMNGRYSVALKTPNTKDTIIHISAVREALLAPS